MLFDVYVVTVRLCFFVCVCVCGCLSFALCCVCMCFLCRGWLDVLFGVAVVVLMCCCVWFVVNCCYVLLCLLLLALAFDVLLFCLRVCFCWVCRLGLVFVLFCCGCLDVLFGVAVVVVRCCVVVFVCCCC